MIFYTKKCLAIIVIFAVLLSPNIILLSGPTFMTPTDLLNSYIRIELPSETDIASAIELVQSNPHLINKQTSSVNQQNNSFFDKTILMWAAQHGTAIQVKQLLDIPGINAGLVDFYGSTAIEYARQFNKSIAIAAALIAAMTSIDLLNSYIRIKHPSETDITSAIKLAQSNPNLVNRKFGSYNETILMWVAQYGTATQVQQLLNIPGIDAGIVSRHGLTVLTALDYAQQFNNPNGKDIAKVLLANK